MIATMYQRSTWLLFLIAIELATLLFGMRTASAQRPVFKAYTPVMDACMNAPQNASTDGQIMCIAEEHARQETRMDASLRRLLPTLYADGDRKRLHLVQKAWARWLETRCGFINADPLSGSMATVEASLCEVNTIAERADELEAMMHPWSGYGGGRATP